MVASRAEDEMKGEQCTLQEIADDSHDQQEVPGVAASRQADIRHHIEMEDTGASHDAEWEYGCADCHVKAQ